MLETDVLVVGGGPAGLAAAIAAGQRGFRVVVVEKHQFPIDKPCGEGVMPEGVSALRQFGITALDRYGRRFHGIRFLENDNSIQAKFPHGWGVGIRRTALHEVLAAHARAAGCTIVCGASVSIQKDGVWIGNEPVRHRWIVAADGRASHMRQGFDDPTLTVAPRRLGLRQHYRVRPWTDFVEVYWRNGYQGYVTPVNDEEVCIALVGAGKELRMNQLAQLFPELAKRLGTAETTSSVAGMNVSRASFSMITKGNCALIGDASGCFDPIIGIGLSLAFQQAVALGEALALGRLDRYQLAHARITRLPRVMTNLILLLDQRESLRQLVFRTLAAYPGLFNWLLKLRVGNSFVSAEEKAPSTGARFGFIEVDAHNWQGDDSDGPQIGNRDK